MDANEVKKYKSVGLAQCGAMLISCAFQRKLRSTIESRIFHRRLNSFKIVYSTDLNSVCSCL